MTKVSIDSKISGWNSGFGLAPNTTYQVRPSATKYTIDNGKTQTDFHGIGDMDGAELGIPAQVRVGGLAVLVWHHRDGNPPVPQIITFPPGKNSDSATIGSDGGSMHFVITDKRGTFGDNSGSCDVEIISTNVPKPLNAERSDNIEGGTMQTRVTLALDGQLTGITRTFTKVNFKGFTGAIRVVLFTDDGRSHVSQEHSYGVDGDMTGGRSDRTDTWTEQVSAEFASRVRECAILQYHNPKFDLGKAFNELKSELGPLIVALVAG